MKQFQVFLAIMCICTSCIKPADNVVNDPTESAVSGSGVFIINEGNFRAGNGSLSWYSYDSSRINNEIFRKVTGRPLGDVPNTMQIFGDKGYIVVNNSGKIEVVEANTLKSVTTITDLNSPRNIAVMNSSKAYVTSMYSNSVAVLDLKKNVVSGYIDIGKTSESIVIAGTKAFVSTWTGGSELTVISTSDDKILGTITVGKEPESMVLDRNNTLWVLCNGGWAREYYAELDGIDVTTHLIKKRLIFPSRLDSPSCLNISSNGDTLYYLQQGVRRLSIADNNLPSAPFIEEGNHLFYKMGVNPVSGELIVTDAVDYQQSGIILRYKRSGGFIVSAQAGIIPGSVCFKVRPNPVTE